MRVLSGLDDILSSLATVLSDLLHVWSDLVKEHVLASESFEIVIELVDVPHVAIDDLGFIRLGVLGNRVVGQMGELVADFVVLIILSSETDVAFLVEPDGQRIPVGHQYPLSDIELRKLLIRGGE